MIINMELFRRGRLYCIKCVFLIPIKLRIRAYVPMLWNSICYTSLQKKQVSNVGECSCATLFFPFSFLSFRCDEASTIVFLFLLFDRGIRRLLNIKAQVPPVRAIGHQIERKMSGLQGCPLFTLDYLFLVNPLYYFFFLCLL